MKNILLLISLTLVLSCKSKEASADESFTYENEKITPAEQGQKLFEGKGNCTACHMPQQKLIGPSLKDISVAYKQQKDAIVKFLREEAKPIVDPAQYEAMKVNFAITKRMSVEELQALETYIYSIK